MRSGAGAPAAALSAAVGRVPLLDDDSLDAPHGFFFGDASVGNAIQVMLEEVDFLLGRKVTVVGHALVMIVRDQVVHVLFQIGPGAANPVDFALANHLGQGEAQLGGTHGARDRDQHFASLIQVVPITLCSIFQRRCIEVPEMMRDELRNSFHGAKGGYWFRPQFKGISSYGPKSRLYRTAEHWTPNAKRQNGCMRPEATVDNWKWMR